MRRRSTALAAGGDRLLGPLRNTVAFGHSIAVDVIVGAATGDGLIVFRPDNGSATRFSPMEAQLALVELGRRLRAGAGGQQGDAAQGCAEHLDNPRSRRNSCCVGKRTATVCPRRRLAADARLGQGDVRGDTAQRSSICCIAHRPAQPHVPRPAVPRSQARRHLGWAVDCRLISS